MRSPVALALLFAATSTLLAQPTFQGLGFLVEDGFSDAFAISADGSTIVGSASNADNNPVGFRWTATGGMVALPTLGNDGYPYNEARAVSANGSVIVGWDYSPEGPLQGYRWTVTEGIQAIPYIEPEGYGYGIANGVSADGSVVVGSSGGGPNAFRWTAAGGTVHLGLDLDVSSEATGVSADGSVVVGWVGGEAFRWTEADGMQILAGPEGSTGSEAFGISGDGSTIVGSYYSADFSEIAVVWRDGQPIALDTLFDDGSQTHAHAVSANGLWAVGHSGGTAAWWDTQTGEVHDLYNMLTGGYGLELDGWTLLSATGISADGTTIVGYGYNPDGGYEGWVANLSAIPEPSTYAALLGGAALAWAAHRRRRSARVPSVPQSRGRALAPNFTRRFFISARARSE